MQDYIQKRVLEISQYILESSATVRQTATVFGVSKSTVHAVVAKRNGNSTLLLDLIKQHKKEIIEAGLA